MGNTFGHLFRLTTWGESHGDAVGVVVDGCPPRLPLEEGDIQRELDRRRPGQSAISTQRREGDKAEILSGVFDGLTLGTPILISVWNQDARSKDYQEMRTLYRPSHADYTYQAKYGIRNWKGGGRASARETIGRVAAGAIAKKILGMEHGVEIVGYVKQVSTLKAEVDSDAVTQQDVESNAVRCPDQGHGGPDGGADQGGPQERRLSGRDCGGGGAERSARAWGPGVRQAGGGPGQGDALPARVQGLRGRVGIRRSHDDGLGAQRPLLQRGRPYQDAHQQLGGAFRAASATGRTSSYGRPSSRRPPS